MSDSNDYRLYLEKCFSALHEKLDAIVEQTTKINGRVSKLEDITFKRQTDVDDFRNLERDFGLVKKSVDDIKSDLEEYRLFKKHPALGIILILAFVVGMGLSAFQTVRSVTGNIKNNEIMQKIEDIEYRLINTYGINPATRSIKALPDTTKKKNIKIPVK